jgi:6-phosphogluconolactonase
MAESGDRRLDMKIEVLADPDAVARRGAELIADDARAAIAVRGRFILAVSGGRTPWLMLRALAETDIPWSCVHLMQVDERIAPKGDPDRNLAHIGESLLARAQLSVEHVHAMPVNAPDLATAAAAYARTLREFAGTPPVLDLVHLGLGADGHTASLLPRDPVLEFMDEYVALTGPYQGRRRMTLTYPVIDGARRILWLVTGEDKAAVLARLVDGDPSIPAGRVRQDQALILADVAAAGNLGPSN